MSRSLSISLDALRFFLAIVVVVTHLAQPMFSIGLPNLDYYGNVAVALFFLLSGFVISYVTDNKETTASEYAVARLSRLYSVMVPAILLSGLVWMVCSMVAPDYLLHWTNASVSFGDIDWLYDRPVLRFGVQSAVSLLFLNQVHGAQIFPAMNLPIWSLGFEGPYYLFFGILIFSKGVLRIVLLLLAATLFGWAILGLFPVWLAGVGLHRLTSRLKLSAKLSIPLGLLCLLLSALLAANFRNFVDWIDDHASLVVLKFLDGHYADTFNMRSNINHIYYYSLVAGFLFILGIHCLESLLSPLLLRVERPIRWCAAHTFSIYLYHFPLLVLIASVTHYNGTSMPAVLAVFLLDLLLCIALSLHTEKHKQWWRQRIRSTFEFAPMAHVSLPLKPSAHREG